MAGGLYGEVPVTLPDSPYAAENVVKVVEARLETDWWSTDVNQPASFLFDVPMNPGNACAIE